MTDESLDVLAATNPALAALIIYFFTDNYARAAGSGPDLALAYLPAPIALSRRLAETFDGTNAATGLLRWTARAPGVLLDLPEQVRATVPVSRSGLIFGLQRGVLGLVEGRLVTQSKGLAKIPKDPAGVDISRRPFSVASRLGTWCGNLKAPATVFVTLGIAP